MVSIYGLVMISVRNMFISLGMKVRVCLLIWVVVWKMFISSLMSRVVISIGVVIRRVIFMVWWFMVMMFLGVICIFVLG